MADFINTIDVLGDDAVMDGIIERTITEFKDDKIIDVGDYAFYGCVALTEVALPNVNSIGPSAFYGCVALTEVALPNVNSIGSSAFQRCSSLESIECPQLTNIHDSAFRECSSLKKITLPLYVRSPSGNEFHSCSALEYVDLPMANKLRAGMFRYCSNLHTLILRNTVEICLLENSTTLETTPIAKGVGYVYVPRMMLSDDDETKDYRRATNWSALADQFRVLEDYTVDGTTTGELDETKI